MLPPGFKTGEVGFVLHFRNERRLTQMQCHMKHLHRFFEPAKIGFTVAEGDALWNGVAPQSEYLRLATRIAEDLTPGNWGARLAQFPLEAAKVARLLMEAHDTMADLPI